jgi:hypothetical protein
VKDPEKMLAKRSAKWLQRWWIYSQVEPFGSIRDDFRAAQCASAVVNNIPLRGRAAKAVTPGDLFETLRVAPKRQSVADMAATASAIVAAFGGEVIKVGRGGNG